MRAAKRGLDSRVRGNDTLWHVIPAKAGIHLLSLAALAFVATGSARAQAPTLTNALGMEFVLVPAGRVVVGRFQPGCPDSAAAEAPQPNVDPRARWTPDDVTRCREMARRDASPGFTATIARPFYIGRYEVTQAQWVRVMRTNPSLFQGSRVKGPADQHPVDNVTWDDAQAFIRRLNALDTTARYRLPTAIEWEYAARAGTEGEPPWPLVRESAWISDVDKGTTHPVGLKKPNAWGLHDTLGNVWEWVEDVYNEKPFPDAAPPPPRAGATHVLRGGSFTSDVKNATWSFHAGGPGNGWDVGFRVVREPR